MDELISQIDDLTRIILDYDQKAYPSVSNNLINSLFPVFSKVISYYALPEMAEYADDATYWPGQLERILSAFETGDDFSLVDILYNETRANLMELKEILEQKGISA